MDITAFKGAIFDLDGTLIDSAHVWSDIDIKFLARRGIAIPPDYAKTVSTMNFNDAAVYTNRRFSLNERPEDMIAEWFSYALEEYTYNIKPRPHAAEYVHMLRERGVRLALATASDERLYTAVLKANGMFDCFEVFASTNEVSRGKGFPDVYELAAERLGLTAGECIVFEDIIEGIRGAKAGGFAAAACINGIFPQDEPAMRSESDIAFTEYRELME